MQQGVVESKWEPASRGQPLFVLEDNDPTGYKSKKAMAAKEEMKIEAIDFPKYSPDLNPCDFFLWSEVQRRMALKKEPRHETVAGYKARLRRTALAIPEAVIRKAVLSIRKRAQQVFDADGGDIPLRATELQPAMWQEHL
jgi:hypothetical protein